VEVKKPTILKGETWGRLEKLKREKEVIGIYLSGHPLDDFRIELTYFCTRNVLFADLTADLIPFKGKEMILGGIVTGVEHRTTKNGKPFGKFKLEDYYGTLEFMLWSEDYLKFRNHLVDGIFVAVKCIVKPRGWGNDQTEQLEIKILHIQLLDELRKNQSKTITLSLHLDSIDESFIESLKNTLDQNKGNNKFRIMLEDLASGTKLETFSRSHKVDLNSRFISFLDRIPKASWELN
jgi:DNA polymerase-3 subunit alpha